MKSLENVISRISVSSPVLDDGDFLEGEEGNIHLNNGKTVAFIFYHVATSIQR